jgi:hypothetical protein
MTPKQAILKECKHCCNGEQAAYASCKSKECQLNTLEIKSWTKRIKSHCIKCVPEQSIFGVQKCDGKIMAPEARNCPLHPYRLGKNPKRQAAGKQRFARNVRQQAVFEKNKAIKPKINGNVPETMLTR